MHWRRPSAPPWFGWNSPTVQDAPNPLLRAHSPTVAQLVLGHSVAQLPRDDHGPVRAPAEKSLADTVAEGGYLTIVEGAIPVKDDGIYCVWAAVLRWTS